MKKFLLAVVVAVCGQFASAIVPEVDYMPDWYTVDGVKNDRHATIVDVTFFHYPGSWVRLSSNTLLRDRVSGTEYRLVKADGITLNEQVNMDESGHLKAKLYFEPVAKSVKSVDLIEVGSGDDKQTYGIHLDRKRQTTSHKSQPKVEDIYNREGEPEAWTPPVRGRLLDEDFITPGGSVHFIGKLDNYVPETGSTVALFRSGGNVSAQLDSVGNFEVDIPVDHVNMVWFTVGDFRGGCYVFPGDTICYNATTKRCLTIKPDGKATIDYEYVTVDCENPETIEINMLKGALSDSLKDLTLGWMEYRKVPSQGYDSVMAYGEKIKGLTREAVARLTRLLTPLNISPKSKDILFSMLLADVNMPLMDVAMYYGDNRMIIRVDEEGNRIVEANPDYVEIDEQKYFGGQDDYIAYLWDNPYMLCDGDMYINRLEYGPVKSMIRSMASGYEGNIVYPGSSVVDLGELISVHKGRRGCLEGYMKEQEAVYGSGNDFMSQLFITNGMLSVINSAEANSESLERVMALGVDMMRLVDYKALQQSYHKALCDLAKRVGVNESGTAANDSSRMIESKSETLAAIVAPYKGRVVFVDVWDAYCGPCRAGMISQKKILEQFKDAPLTVIYIAPENNRAACEKFLKENDIKGEHVFLSNDDDARFRADFDIQAIPFTILINKKGEYTTKFACNLDYVFEQALAE